MGLLMQPPEVWIKLSNARRKIFHRELNDAEMLLKEIIEIAPHQGEAQGRLGRIIYERGNPSEFTDWQIAFPTRREAIRRSGSFKDWRRTDQGSIRARFAVFWRL